MIMVMCSIYDGKAEAWFTPMFFQSKAQAIRSFGDAVNNSGSDFGKHPEDYVLFCIGSFNQRDGVLDTQTPESLAVGVNLIRNDVPSQVQQVQRDQLEMIQ